MMVRNLLTMLAELIVFVMIDIIMLVAMDFSPSSIQIVAMVFMNLSFAVLIISPLLVPKTESRYIFSVSMSMISTALVVVETILGILFIILNWNNVLVVSIIMALFFVILVALMILEFSVDRESAGYEDVTRDYRRKYITDTEMMMETAMYSAADKGMTETAKVLEHAYDAIRNMPWKDKAETIELDKQIHDMACNIVTLIANEDSDGAIGACKELESLIVQRNIEFRKAQT